jgi:hypothetical protein
VVFHILVRGEKFQSTNKKGFAMTAKRVVFVRGLDWSDDGFQYLASLVLGDKSIFVDTLDEEAPAQLRDALQDEVTEVIIGLYDRFGGEEGPEDVLRNEAGVREDFIRCFLRELDCVREDVTVKVMHRRLSARLRRQQKRRQKKDARKCA